MKKLLKKLLLLAKINIIEKISKNQIKTKIELYINDIVIK